MKTFASLSILIFVVLFTSCDETKKVIDVAGNVQLTGSYTVNSLKGEKVMSETTPTFTLSALNNSFQANTGCNAIFGSYALDLYAITFSDLAVTSKICGKDAMDVERDFLDALNKTGSYEIQNNILTLYSKTDRSVLLKATKDKKN